MPGHEGSLAEAPGESVWNRNVVKREKPGGFVRPLAGGVAVIDRQHPCGPQFAQAFFQGPLCCGIVVEGVAHATRVVGGNDGPATTVQRAVKHWRRLTYTNHDVFSIGMRHVLGCGKGCDERIGCFGVFGKNLHGSPVTVSSSQSATISKFGGAFAGWRLACWLTSY